MGNYDDIVGEIYSCAFDWIPGVGSVKGIYEFTVGKDAITEKKLNGFQRTMCLLSAVPIAGNSIKTITKSEEILVKISTRAKFLKYFDKSYEAYHSNNSYP